MQKGKRHLREFSARVTVFAAAFLVAFAVAQLWTGQLAANHAGASSPNNTCGKDGEYYHVHWEQLTTPNNVFFKLEIFNESGATGQYSGAVVNARSAWNGEQSHVKLIQDNLGTPDFLIRVAQFQPDPIAFLGKTTLDPNQCVAPYSNQSTHATRDGNSRIWINSQEIEAQSSPAHARQWTVTHEVGHVLGLGHDNDNPTHRLMYWAYGSSRPTLPLFGDSNRMTLQADPYGHTD